MIATFDGATYVHLRDSERLSAQLVRVFELMKDGEARTLAEIAAATESPPASVSARLRDLRKEKFGGHSVGRFHLGEGLYSYRLTLRETLA